MKNALNQLSTQEAQDLFMILFTVNLGNITTTCEQVGISRSTYYNWMKEQEFTDRLAHVSEERLDLAEHALLSAVQAMDVTAIRYYLDSQGRSRGYGKASQLEISGPDGTPIAGTVDVQHYPPEPATMLEWEEQVAVSRALRLAEQSEKAKEQAQESTDASTEGAESSSTDGAE